MADDIFERMWMQLSRIYGAVSGSRAQLGSGRETASSFVVNKAVNALGLQDVKRFVGLAIGDLKKATDRKKTDDDAPGNGLPQQVEPVYRRSEQQTAAGTADSVGDDNEEVRRLVGQSGILSDQFKSLGSDLDGLREQVFEVNQALGAELLKPLKKANKAGTQAADDRLGDGIEKVAGSTAELLAVANQTNEHVSDIDNTTVEILKILNQSLVVQRESLEVLKHIRDKKVLMDPNGGNAPAGNKTAMNGNRGGMFA